MVRRRSLLPPPPASSDLQLSHAPDQFYFPCRVSPSASRGWLNSPDLPGRNSVAAEVGIKIRFLRHRDSD